MQKHLTLALDPDPTTWEHVRVEDVCAFLMSRFPVFPDNGRIYHGTVSEENDVTPCKESIEEDIERLSTLPGPFHVVIYPGAALPILVAIGIAVASYLLIPKPQIPVIPSALRNSQQASPNNDLASRTNQARLEGRIPDIFGTVVSTPDLIAATYSVFENNREVEHAYMCVGRGEHEIPEDEVRDDKTRCLDIVGVSVEIYAPYTSPNSGDDPQLRIGNPIGQRVLQTTRSNSVNGQVLRPSNPKGITGNGNIAFARPNKIIVQTGQFALNQVFSEGDELTVTDAVYVSGATIGETILIHSNQDNTGFYVLLQQSVIPAHWTVGATLLMFETIIADNTITDALLGGTYTITAVSIEPYDATYYKITVNLDDPNSHLTIIGSGWTDTWHPNAFYAVTQIGTYGTDIDLSGVYTIVSVGDGEILLDDPASVNSDWNLLPAPPQRGGFLSPGLSASGEKWIGPFVLEDTELDRVYCNFVSPNGLFKDNGTTQVAEIVTIEVELVPVDADDVPRGFAEYFTTTLAGSDTLKETVAVTLRCVPVDFTGRCTVRARRVSQTDEAFTGTVVDEVRWRDAYSVAPVSEDHFGNITTVYAVTYATASALSIKERKLNMRATRKIPTRVSGSVFTTALTATNDIAEIFSAICLDEYIGRRRYNEIDFDNIYDTVDAIEAYFGTDLVRQFNYTFDKENLSFEECIQQVGSVMFSVVYRQGNEIKISFEKATENSVLLFNSRNKVPKTEKRSVRFGRSSTNDGIHYTYVDPFDGSIRSIFLPVGYAARNPKRIESVGVADHLQAYFHAWRQWNKILYQNSFVEFEALQEADILVRNDRIAVADGTRPFVQDGEVLAIATLELTLSHEVDLTGDPPYVIFLQHTDGQMEIIPITAGSAANKVVLDDAPRISLVTDPDKVRTTYIVVGDTDQSQMAFILTERNPQSTMTSVIRAANYDARYYANDTDFINDIIDENGYGPAGGYTPGTGTGFLVLPDAPVLSTSLAGDDITLTWTTPDAGTYPITGYNIYNADTDAFVTTDTASPLVISDQAPGTYNYFVRAVDSQGNESPDSNTDGETITSGTLKFVALAGNSTVTNRLMISLDGVTWSLASSAPPDRRWLCVAFSPSLQLFVALGRSGTGDRVMHSSDGETWTLGSISQDNFYTSVCWSETLGIFVAVSSTGTNRVWTSPDGTTWTARNAASAQSWQKVIWADELGLFVAVANDANSSGVMTSPDGTTWTTRTPSANKSWVCVDYSPALNLLCAVATDTTNSIMTSPDGTTWTTQTPATADSYSAIAWSEDLGLFAAGGASSGGAALMTSPDGTTWTAQTPFNNIAIRALMYSPDVALFVGVGSQSSTKTTIYSADGDNWSTTVGPGSSTDLWGCIAAGIVA